VIGEEGKQGRFLLVSYHFYRQKVRELVKITGQPHVVKHNFHAAVVE